MSKLIKEIKESKWQIKELKEACEKISGGNSKITKSLNDGGTCPAITCLDIFESKTYIDKCEIFVSEETSKNTVFAEFGDVIMARSGYTRKNQDGFRLFLGDFKAYAGNNTYLIKHNQNPKYLYCALTNIHFKTQLELFFKESLSSIKMIDLGDIRKLKIPILSLELQEKIGNFLFKFAEYEKKLQKELEKRKKQFQYYKELLFAQIFEKCRLRN